MGKKTDADKALATALEKANAIQLYVYARGLQRQGNAKRAFELYPQVPKKDANHWISHLALARVDSNKGDFPAAAKEMTQAISGAPDQTKPFLEPLLKRLEAKDDINK
jgi:tetratricopeptide (TPR) repeat protein